ncbi:MAG TPA: FecR domain-containing protein [Chitinophagaceae bacterium]|nr:FecR domain-containing protein [Chitinophagaceae bacterium]
MNPQRIGQLFFLYTLHQLTPADEAELNAWREESIHNEALFQKETHPDLLLETINSTEDSKDRILQKIKEKYPGPWSVKPLKSPVRLYRIARIAAIFIVVLGAGLFFLLRGNKSIQPASYTASLIDAEGVSQAIDGFTRGFEDGYAAARIEKDEHGNLIYTTQNDSTAGKDRYNTVRTPRGGYYTVELPDSTRVWLNAQSSLRYPANFHQDSITIYVSGETYIEVPKNLKGGLRIITDRMRVQSNGGELNIQLYDDEPQAITLTNGTATVKLNPNGPTIDTTSILLKPSEQALMTVMKGTENLRLTIDSIADMQSIIAWKNGTLLFQRATIYTIMRTLSRWYNVDIVYQDSISDKRYSFNISRDASIMEVLRTLQHQGLYSSIVERKIIVGVKP